jgi:2-polyprenyl-6-hydroxyphenyl methylase/3-demethylubiquinone-9 3-methyltransferase
MTRLSALVAELPRLDRSTAFASRHVCKICGGDATWFDRVDFNKYCSPENFYEYGISGIDVNYFRCLECSYLFTVDFDDWSSDEFAKFVYNDDYIKVDSEYVKVRPEQYAIDFARRFAGCEEARILDYGSGAGVFVRGMRERGYRHIEAYDPFSNPLRPEGTFDIITCFEVVEHLADPVATLGDMKSLLRADGCIIFSQTVQPADILAIRGNWWYLAPRNGHISTYSEEALVALGRRHQLLLHRGSNCYGFAPAWPSSFAARALECTGPSFATLRLTAPREVPINGIAFPSREQIIWHPMEDDGLWRFRWTGAALLQWEARWGPVACLELRVPVLHEIEPGFGLRCALELNGQRKPVRMDRGELVADFDVRGRLSGTIALHTPEPDRDKAKRGRRRGLGIRTETGLPQSVVRQS